MENNIESTIKKLIDSHLTELLQGLISEIEEINMDIIKANVNNPHLIGIEQGSRVALNLAQERIKKLIK